IAQVIAHDRPDLIRRMILAGTGPAGGKGTSDLAAVLQGAFQNAAAQKKHPKHLLFFSQTKTSQAAADAFLARLQARKNDRDPAASNETTQAQSAAIIQWGKSSIFPDAGHGGIFQYHREFTEQALRFFGT